MKTIINTAIVIGIAFLLNHDIIAQQKSTFIDSRDGKTYKTVKIGTQIWMAENLAFKAPGGCWSYENKENNVTTYGYLYNMETAKTVCPSGWHLPTDAEWAVITEALGGLEKAGSKMKSVLGWNGDEDNYLDGDGVYGDNESNFTALPGGYYWLNDGTFNKIGSQGCWWSSTVSSIGSCYYYRYMSNSNNNVERDYLKETSGLSVRCIKD